MRLALHCSPLPYVPVQFPGELLSSWLRRAAAEFGVSLECLGQHFGLSRTKPIDIDQDLTAGDIQRLAIALRSSPADIRQAMHHRLPSPVRALRATRTPIQVCSACRTHHVASSAEPVLIKAWFELWQIECRFCRTPLSSVGGPILDQCNPAREMPNWFAQLLPAARIGAVRLFSFARRPFNTSLSPVAVLCLMSTRLDPQWAPPKGEIDDETPWPGQHCVAELFVQGLRDLSREESLVPALWTEKKPVRLVTARTILLAALARFLKEPQRSFRMVRCAAGARTHAFVERWLRGLPPHSQEFLSIPGDFDANRV